LGSFVFQLDDRANPPVEVVGFGKVPAHPRQLEVGMRVDEAGQDGDFSQVDFI
jgi:hypothetical protein